ncbi:hypothetical protein [Bacillus coahuilensis]|uniref:hypothetical protein n=1 Tax=Bacillus coahuilensis TaxID=408580 RepID=UPI00018514E8|nr:hypothetical protein [Bacillus coahuilensis]
MNKIILFLTATLLWFTASIPVSEAHEYSASYTTVTVDQEALLVTFSIDDLSVLEHIDADQNQTNQIEEEELQLVQDSVVEWYNQNVILTFNDVAQRGMLESILLEEKNDKTYVTISQSYPTTDSLITLQDSLYLDSSWKTTYTNFVSIQQGEDFTETILKGENRTASIDASTLGEASSTANASWLEFFYSWDGAYYYRIRPSSVPICFTAC